MTAETDDSSSTAASAIRLANDRSRTGVCPGCTNDEHSDINRWIERTVTLGGHQRGVRPVASIGNRS